MKSILFLLCLLAAPALHAQAPQSDALRVELMFWESVRNSTDPADFRAYLEKYPQGQFAPLARNRLATLDSKPAGPAAAPITPAAPVRAGPPIAGDTWTYVLLDSKTGKQKAQQEVRLVSATGETLVEEIISTGGARSRFEHPRGNYIYQAGEITLFSPYAINYGVPMFGRVDNFDARTCRAGWTCSVRGRVASSEPLRVAAGTFNTIRVEISQNWTTPSQTNDRGESVARTITVWYAQDVKRIVRATSRGTPSAWLETDFELELVSYQLKQ